MKRRGGEVTGEKKSSKKLVTVVTAAMIVMAAVITALFVASAAPDVDKFTIEPDKGITRAISHYNATVNSTETISSLNITIPAGFGAANDTMQAGDIIAKVELYNSTGWYGNVTIAANTTEPTTKVDVFAWVGTQPGAAKGIVMNYNAGGTTTIQSPFVGGASKAELKMPTPAANGSLNISLPASADIRNATISIGQFVRNPATAGNYDFVADGVKEKVQIIAPTFNFEFIEPPASPQVVNVSDVMNVTVNITIDGNLTAAGLTDEFGIVNLSWRNETSGVVENYTMEMIANNTWWSTFWLNVSNVTTLAAGNNYTYRVYASDIWNNTGVSPTKTVNVTVMEYGTIIGKIVYANGTGIVGAVINLTQNGNLIASTLSDVNGNYNFTNVTPCTYSVNVSKAKIWGGTKYM